jgi:hypothetical protein
MLTLTHSQRRTRSATRSAHCSLRIRPGGPASGYNHPAPTSGYGHPAPTANAKHPAPSAGARHSRELVAA